mmetsp:Transcript_45065/g.95876  ORF Transcript_45065/g.95876 Transcript_45065/m.95876 type:complete len:352 (+) Transcript_45065:1011-2066(+)
MKVDVILLGTHASALADLHGHGPADDVAARQVLGAGRVPFHEPLALAVAQDAPLAAASFGNQAARAVDPRGVELDELGVLVGQSRPHGHGVPVPGARVGAGAAEVGPPVPSRRQHGVLGLDPMQRPVLHVERHGPHAASVVRHEQVHGEVLDEVRRVERQRAPVEGVEHGVPRPVRGARAAVGLPALTEIQTLPSERPLVNLPLLRPRERQPELLQLQHGLGRLAAHVVDGVLIPQPVAALDGVVHVPPPVVGSHVPQRGVDPPLGGDGVTAGGEELADAGRLEARLRQAHGGAQAAAAGADYQGVVGVVHHRVVSREGGGGGEGAGIFDFGRAVAEEARGRSSRQCGEHI